MASQTTSAQGDLTSAAGGGGGIHPTTNSNPSTSASSTTPRTTVDLSTAEYVETRSVMLEWKVTNLKALFDASKGEAKSKCLKSALFDNHRWQIFLYPNSGHEQYCSLYLSCEPTPAEKERGLAERERMGMGMGMVWSSAVSGEGGGEREREKERGQGGREARGGPWKREGKFKFTFEVRSLDRSRTLFKQMEANDWHSFSASAPNWGYASFLKRSDAYFNNAIVRTTDAFLIVCTIVYSPTEPSPPPLPRLLIPKDLVTAYASLFDDPEYSDVVFRIRPSNRPDKAERRLYAIKKVLAGRCEYFNDMFSSGFHESLTHRPSSNNITSSSTTTSTFSSSPRRPAPASFDDEGGREGLGQQQDLVDDDEDTDWDEDDDTDVGSSSDDDAAADEDGDEDSGVPESEEPAPQRGEEQQSGTEVEAEEPTSDGDVAGGGSEGKRQQRRRRHRTTTHDSSLEELGADDEMAVRFVDAPTAPDSPVKPSRRLVGGRREGVKGGGKTTRNQPDQRPRFEVVVTDAAYQSYRALLHYLYTDSITFAPLASTYHVARETSLQTGTPFPYESRRAYLLANTPTMTTSSSSAMMTTTTSSGEGVGPCSAKAIYRLADKIGLGELKKRAFDHIVKSLTVQNIPYEVFGSFSSRFEEIKRVEIAFLLERWSEAKAAPSMRKVFDNLRTGRYPGFEDVWRRILGSLEYVPQRDGRGEEDEAAR